MKENVFIDLLKLEKHHKVLLVGFGKGKRLATIAPLVESVTGIEISDELVNKVASKLPFDNIELKTGFAENLPVSDSSFDITIIFNVFHELTDGPKALTEIYRVLKPNGRLIIRDPIKETMFVKLFNKMAKDQTLRTFEELKKELLAANFSNIIGEKFRTKCSE